MFDSARGQDLRVVKPINYRPILFCALSLIAGVLLCRYYPVMGVWTVLTPLFVLCLICALLFLVVDKKTRPTVVITCLFCFIFAIIGMVSFDLKLKSTTKGNVEDGAYVVVGEVKDVTYKDGVYYAIDHSPEQFKELVDAFDGDAYAVAEEYFSTISNIVEKTGAHVLGHFDVLKKFNANKEFFDENHPRYQKAYNDALEKLIKTHLFLSYP